MEALLLPSLLGMPTPHHLTAPSPPSPPRPDAAGTSETVAPAAPRQPLRPIEWAFLASVALAAAGTAVALGGLASAQALCNKGGQQGNFMVRSLGEGERDELGGFTGCSCRASAACLPGCQVRTSARTAGMGDTVQTYDTSADLNPLPMSFCLYLQGTQEDCATFLSWPWFGWALQVAVLAAVLAAWSTASIHSYKQSLWALAAVVIFTSCHAANKLYIMQPYSQGTLHQRQVRAGGEGAGRGEQSGASTRAGQRMLGPRAALSCAGSKLLRFQALHPPRLASCAALLTHPADCGAVGLHRADRRRLPDGHHPGCSVSNTYAGGV